MNGRFTWAIIEQDYAKTSTFERTAGVDGYESYLRNSMPLTVGKRFMRNYSLLKYLIIRLY